MNRSRWLIAIAVAGVAIFGHVVWIGGPAIPALLGSAVPAYFLGRAKRRMAMKIDDKISRGLESW